MGNVLNMYAHESLLRIYMQDYCFSKDFGFQQVKNFDVTWKHILLAQKYIQADIYSLKVNNKKIRARCEISYKITIKTP